VEYLTTPGSFVEYTVNVAAAGQYTVNTRYAAGRGQTEKMSIYVNNTRDSQAAFPTTNSWLTWGNSSVTLALRVGLNTIRYEYNASYGDTGWLNVDYIHLQDAAVPCSNCQPYQRLATATNQSAATIKQSAYPNPAADYVNLAAGTTHIELVNQLGQVLLSQDYLGTGLFNIQSLPNGLYQLRTVQAGKIVSERLEIRR
jgi:hypothetical protein